MNNDFEITGKVIGKGAFGEVRQGVNKKTGEEVAIKIIPKTNTNMESLAREISILQSCDHSNIIRFYGYYEQGDKIYIVSELARGGELFDHIVKRKKYNEEDARAIIKQIVSSLCYLHLNKVAHLDLKPENLLLKEVPDNYNDPNSKFTPLVKLADFGTSVMFTEEVQNQRIVAGTPGYVAPEVLLKKKFSTEPDIYAVGVITYVMLSGCMPFHSNDIKEMLRKQVKGQWSFNQRFNNVSENAKDFITQCMTTDYKFRPTAPQLLNHKWMQEVAVGSDLLETQQDLKRYLAKLRLKAGFAAIVAANRMIKLEELMQE